MWNAWLLHIATVATIYHKSEYTPHISAQILELSLGKLCHHRPQLGLLVTPKFRLVTMRARAFSVVAPRLWNVLPQNICQASSLLSFVNLLKTHFFLSITLESIVCELYPVMDVYLHSLCISNLIL